MFIMNIILFFAYDTFDRSTANWILFAVISVFVLYHLIKIMSEMKKKLEESSTQGKYLFSRKKDIYLYHLRNTLMLLGLYIIPIGGLLLEMPWKWLVIDFGIILIGLAYAIEYHSKGRSDILKWEE
ncbi:hypothetical protein [Macrococcus brunensis]|uniref:hypothetical protein n=1 Tax=Macrococcus brunensis TaxID=198483 RepID=UPI001EF07A7E|nr:hypothetical protein [Macrococcus brunensis]ULG74560.1 hypothetical protein MGG13_01965 [Macrococcus brunensis]